MGEVISIFRRRDAADPEKVERIMQGAEQFRDMMERNLRNLERQRRDRIQSNIKVLRNYRIKRGG